MISISEKQISEKSNDYHIKIVGATALMRNGPRCREVINVFLGVLFALDFVPSGTGNEPGDPPLEFNSCDFEDASPSVLQVELRLKDNTDQTFDEAAKRFCQLMFDPRANGHLKLLTPFGLLGTSALPGPFKRYWTQTCFIDCISHGPRLLTRINSSYDGGYLPEWALTLSFVVLAGLDLEIFTIGTALSNPGSFTSLAVRVVSSILEKYEPLAEHVAAWESSREELIIGMKVVSIQLHESTDIRKRDLTSHQHQLEAHYKLCEALYDATVTAAKAFTSNKDLLRNFVKLQKAAAASTMRAGLTAAVALVQVGTAVSVVTTSQAVPLAAWGLAEAAALVTTGQMPMLVTTAVSVVWPVAIVAGGVSALMGVKGYLNMREKQKFQARVAYHEHMKVIITRAWELAHITHKLLRWIHTTGAAAADFVDAESRTKWALFIQEVRAVAGETFTSTDLGPRMVEAYLTEQRLALDRLITELGQVA